MLIVSNDRPNHEASISPAALIVWGPGAASSSHSHNCVQLVLALAGTLRVRLGSESRWRRRGAVLVAPNTTHEVDGRGTRVLIAFLDPERELARPLAERLQSNIVSVPDSAVARWRRALGNPGTLEPPQVEAWARAELLRQSQPRRIHPGVQHVLYYLRQRPLDPRHTSLARLAQIAGLSPSRFMHVFSDSMGIPLRPYLLWLRVQRAAGALSAGQSITDAAYVAGFADASHLTRTFRRTLGATPGEMIERASATRGLALRQSG
jgi:AraC-like DNA-binding protein/quercetin dioxygenase-like cupin family protein